MTRWSPSPPLSGWRRRRERLHVLRGVSAGWHQLSPARLLDPHGARLSVHLPRPRERSPPALVCGGSDARRGHLPLHLCRIHSRSGGQPGTGRTAGVGMSDVVWRTPPPAQGSGSRNMATTKWERALAPLREHPGRWAQIEVLDTARKARVLANNLSRSPRFHDRWRFATRTEHGKGVVYAQFVGDET